LKSGQLGSLAYNDRVVADGSVTIFPEINDRQVSPASSDDDFDLVIGVAACDRNRRHAT
jgi:hypothetical protein